MAPNKSQAFVLSRREYRETSLLLTFFTRDFGRMGGIIKGIRTSGQLEYVRIEPGSLVDIVFYPSRRSNLNLITQCDLINYFAAIHADLDKLSWTFYVLEIANSMTLPAEINSPGIFDLLHRTLTDIAAADTPLKPALLFAYKFLVLNGLIDEKSRGRVPVKELREEVERVIASQIERPLRASKFLDAIYEPVIARESKCQ